MITKLQKQVNKAKHEDVRLGLQRGALRIMGALDRELAGRKASHIAHHISAANWYTDHPESRQPGETLLDFYQRKGLGIPNVGEAKP